MVKITFSRFKHINLTASIALMLIAILIAGCVGEKAPEARLDIAAKAASGLIISHSGGDTLMLKDMKLDSSRLLFSGGIVQVFFGAGFDVKRDHLKYIKTVRYSVFNR